MRFILFISSLIIGFSALFAQAPYPGCPDVTVLPEDPSLEFNADTILLNCAEDNINLDATFLNTGATNDYKVESIPFTPPFPFTDPNATALFVGADDVFSNAIDLPFDFCFYDQIYNQIVVAANGFVTFDVGRANANACWCMAESVPTTSTPSCALGSCLSSGLYGNSIFGAALDLDPTVGSPDINYSVLGTAPCRTFVVNFTNVAHFSSGCEAVLSTQQIVLYETTNAIEVYIKDKPLCPGWNDGNAVIGIMNDDGTEGVSPPNRNTGSWTATDEAWRFTPDGTPNYTVTWYDNNGVEIGSGLNLNIPIIGITEVNAEVIYGACDGNNVIVTDKVFVKPRTAPVFEVTVEDIDCFGSCRGSAMAMVTSGNDGGGYTWSSGKTSMQDSLLCAGEYEVTVKDITGCEAIKTFTINEAEELTIDIDNQVDNTCFNADNGAISLSADGGTPNYTWSISSPIAHNNDGNFNNLPSGNYTITIEDAKNCTKTTDIFIDQPEAIEIDTFDLKAANCLTADGSISVTASGGETVNNSYNFSWNPPNEIGENSASGTTVTITNLGLNTYTVYVSDLNECIDSISFVMKSTSGLAASVINIKDISCKGQNDGSASIQTLGGTSPFEFSWNSAPFSTSNSINNLGPGNHAVAIRDATNCTLQLNFNIDEPSKAVDVKTVSKSNPLCFGDNNGKIEVAGTGGTGQLTYQWSNSFPNTSTLTNLQAGSYDLTVTDENNCFKLLSETLIEPTEIKLSVSTNDVTCFGLATGNAIANASGGTGNLAYNWSNGRTSSSNNNLPSGSYIVTVKDLNGCNTTETITINSPTKITAQSSSEDETCQAQNGASSVVSTGGSLPHEITWSNNASDFTLLGLSKGTYVFTITDNQQCSLVDTVLINRVGGFSADISTTEVLCNNGYTGTATATPSNSATPPFDYEWKIEGVVYPTNTDNFIDGLKAGTGYSVKIQDNNKCEAEEFFGITEPSPIAIVLDGLPTECANESTGSATVSIDANSGTAPFTATWTAGTSSSDGLSVTDLPIGRVGVTITDDNNCAVSDFVTIVAPNPIDISAEIESVACKLDNTGSIEVQAVGGTGILQYKWTNGATTNIITNLFSNTYTVSVQDANDCITTATYEITEPNESLAITFSDIMDATCHSTATGTATSLGSGGTPPYAYTWSDPSSQSSSTALNLAAGEYTVSLTDSKNCLFSAAVEIEEPLPISLNIIEEMAETCFGANGQLTVQATGGTPSYTYNWSNTASGSTVSGLSAAAYEVTVQDFNNCQLMQVFDVSRVEGDLDGAVIQVEHIICHNEANGIIAVDGINGAPPYQFEWNNGLTSSQIEQLSEGIYTVTISDAFECEKILQQQIINPPEVAISLAINDAICYQYSDGSIVPIIENATEPYTYNWSNGSTNANLTEVGIGTYSVTVTDANNCFATQEGFVSEPEEIVIDAGEGLVYITETMSKEIGVSVTPASNYDYFWTPTTNLEQINANRVVVRPTETIVYYVTAMDNNGCFDTDSVRIEVTPYTDIILPNAFSPDGDGENDLFGDFLSNEYEVKYIVVYNRWGQQIYAGSGPWDGRLNGEYVEVGSYSYIAEVQLTDQTAITDQQSILKGNVSVLR